MLSQFQEAAETIFIKNRAFVVFSDLKVLFDCFVDLRRKAINYLAQSFVDIALLCMFEVLKLCVS